MLFFRKLGADRFEAVAAVGGPVERQFNRPVMRQIDVAPVTSLNNLSEAGPVLAPALSRCSASGQSSPRWNFQFASSERCSRGKSAAAKLRDKKRGARAGNQTANERASFRSGTIDDVCS